jgi:hypothetical protein
MASLRRAKVLGNYEMTGQGPPAQDRKYAKLSPEGIYSLLEAAGKMHVNNSIPNTVSARTLLERMSEGHWQCRATAHEGGRPNDPAPDPYLHFNIYIVRERRTYHVRCHAHALGGVVVFLVKFS